MTLYEIDDDIRDILAQMEPDETGMLPENYEELTHQIDALQMQRQTKLENAAKYVLNIKSDLAAVKEESERLESRKKALENKVKSLMAYLDYACGGKKTSFGVATLSYRTTEKVEITDYHKAIQYLAANHHSECIRTYEPEIAKAEVKILIKSGVEVPGVAVIKSTSCSLR